MLERSRLFLRKSYEVAKSNLKNFVTGIISHGETIAILTLASVGGTALFARMPIYYMLPYWVNVSMLGPLLAVGLVLMLVKVAEKRELASIPSTYPI